MNGTAAQRADSGGIKSFHKKVQSEVAYESTLEGEAKRALKPCIYIYIYIYLTRAR